VSKVVSQVQDGFHNHFPRHPLDDEFHFASWSSMRPLRTRCRQARHTEAVVEGEIRLTPAYRVADVVAAVQSLVDSAVKDILSHHSNEQDGTNTDEHTGDKSPSKVELLWTDRPHKPSSSRRPRGRNTRGRGDSRAAKGGPQKASFLELAENLEGVVVDRSTEGHCVLANTLAKVCGEHHARQFSVNGSVPHVRRLRDAGFDVQLFGFGVAEWHRQEAEYCSLCDMQQGNRVLQRLVEHFGHLHEDFAESSVSGDNALNTTSVLSTQPDHDDAAEKPSVLDRDAPNNEIMETGSDDSLSRAFVRQATYSEPTISPPPSPTYVQSAKRPRAHSGPISGKNRSVKTNEQVLLWPPHRSLWTTNSAGQRSNSRSSVGSHNACSQEATAETLRSSVSETLPSSSSGFSRSVPDLWKRQSVPTEFTMSDIKPSQSEGSRPKEVFCSTHSPFWCGSEPSPPRDASTGLISSPPQTPRASALVDLLCTPEVGEDGSALVGAGPEESSLQQEGQLHMHQEGEGEENGWFPYIQGFSPF